MAYANSSFARRVWSVRQTLFPAFERKGYHLQFRHGVLSEYLRRPCLFNSLIFVFSVAIMLMAVSFVLPAFPQTPDFPNAKYTASAILGIEASYNRTSHPAA